MPERLTINQNYGRGPKAYDRVVTAIRESEEEIEVARVEFEDARNRLAIAAAKYAAVRDIATEAFGGGSPYDANFGMVRRYGLSPRMRYINMKLGDAINEVLRDEAKDHPITLDEIAFHLGQGHWNYPERVSLRAVNAALLRLSGLSKTEVNGKAAFEIPPFEPKAGAGFETTEEFEAWCREQDQDFSCDEVVADMEELRG
jgi:hypothetical protein